ncbi:MAG: tetratricopeptide repeat protein [Planctomycetota bacterium]
MIDDRTIAAYDAARPELAKKPFRSACYAPYTSLYFNTNGDVIACCKNTTYVLGNVADERLADIWRGKKAQAMRKALRAYKFGTGCEFCEWQVKGGQYDQVYARVFDVLPVRGEAAEWPSRLEFTVSNTCNLACVMCYGVLSSTIRAHREKLPPLPKVYDDQFFADLKPFLPHLHNAKFFGGEPFLAQENYRIWDMMIADKIVIPCHVTTNGTQWNSKVERVLAAFPCNIAVSMDGATKATVESVRVNANFEEVRANVEHFLAYCRKRGTVFTLTYCLMRQNWHEFGDYLVYAEQRGIEVFINTVIDPADCSLYTLPPADLRAIASRMTALDTGGRYSKLRTNGRVWNSALQALVKNADERQRAEVGAMKEAREAKDPLRIGWDLVRDGKLDEAMAAVAGVGPDDQRHYGRLVLEGHVLRRLNRFADAEATLGRAVAMNRRGPNAFLERAWLWLAQNRFAEAAEAAESALRNCEGMSASTLIISAQGALGLALVQSGRIEEGLAAAARAVELAPDNPDTLLQSGWVAWHSKRYDEAEAACARAAGIQPGHGGLANLRQAIAGARRA